MTTSSTPPIVYETDLEPIYYQDCFCHKELVFCKNWKFSGEIFKYNSSGKDCSIRRVQCDCCVYKEQEIDEEMFEKVKTFKNALDPRQIVQNDCFQHLSPLYSKFCEHYGHMIGFFWNSLKDTVIAYDIADGVFQETKDCGCCLFHKDVYLTNHTFFEKSHRDEYGQTMICMDINWHTKEHGKMSIFFNSQGFIGEYRWNRVAQCFKLIKQLDVKTTEYEVADRTNDDQNWSSFSYDAIYYLEKEYRKTKYISSTDCRKISENIHLDEEVIEKWFRARRATSKREANSNEDIFTSQYQQTKLTMKDGTEGYILRKNHDYFKKIVVTAGFSDGSVKPCVWIEKISEYQIIDQETWRLKFENSRVMTIDAETREQVKMQRKLNSNEKKNEGVENEQDVRDKEQEKLFKEMAELEIQNYRKLPNSSKKRLEEHELETESGTLPRPSAQAHAQAKAHAQAQAQVQAQAHAQAEAQAQETVDNWPKLMTELFRSLLQGQSLTQQHMQRLVHLRTQPDFNQRSYAGHELTAMEMEALKQLLNLLNGKELNQEIVKKQELEGSGLTISEANGQIGSPMFIGNKEEVEGSLQLQPTIANEEIDQNLKEDTKPEKSRKLRMSKRKQNELLQKLWLKEQQERKTESEKKTGLETHNAQNSWKDQEQGSAREQLEQMMKMIQEERRTADSKTLKLEQMVLEMKDKLEAQETRIKELEEVIRNDKDVEKGEPLTDPTESQNTGAPNAEVGHKSNISSSIGSDVDLLEDDSGED